MMSSSSKPKASKPKSKSSRSTVPRKRKTPSLSKVAKEALASAKRPTLDTEIRCLEPARQETPECDCWEKHASKQSTPGCWLTPEYWSPAIFASLPPPLRDGVSMRVCSRTGRLAHIALANGDLGIDLSMLTEDPTDPQNRPPVWVQHGYCCRCDRYEWFRLSERRPDTPIVWFSCSK